MILFYDNDMMKLFYDIDNVILFQRHVWYHNTRFDYDNATRWRIDLIMIMSRCGLLRYIKVI